MDADFVAAPAELGDHVGGEEPGVASRDVDIDVIDVQKAVEHLLELAEQLDLVKEDIVCLAIGDAAFDVVEHDVGVTQLSVFKVVQHDRDDVIVPNA